MSVEEDAELKNLVAQTLENKGILPKIRAELRANVFLALEENPSTKETLLKNDELSAFVKIPVGILVLNLIREFLEFFELEFTLSVFDPETKYGKDYIRLTKDKMIKELKLADCKMKNPLLYEVIKEVINSNELKNNEKSTEDFIPVNLSGNVESLNLMPSPLGLNSTFIKSKSDADSVPASPIEIEEHKEDESIKEMVSANVSDVESSVNSCSALSPKNSDDLLFLNENSKKTEHYSQGFVPKEPVEIDLLTFTPIKENKAEETTKDCSLPNTKETKTAEKKASSKFSVLGDLPPLNPISEEKGDKISGIKAIIDKWSDLENEDEFSICSKSSKEQGLDKLSSKQEKSERSDISQKSDKTESVDDFEEEISDLINGHSPSLTADETISKASAVADYLESL